jgi:hypothetical protein
MGARSLISVSWYGKRTPKRPILYGIPTYEEHRLMVDLLRPAEWYPPVKTDDAYDVYFKWYATLVDRAMARFRQYPKIDED